LQAEVKEGRFRADLFYRLNVLPFVVPPLRDRMEDLDALLEHFVQESARKEGVTPIRFSPQADLALRRHNWPGNVRELRNLIERWTILHPGQTITPSELPPEMTGGAGEAAPSVGMLGTGSIEEVLDRLERQMIEQALAGTEGHRGLAADKLGISRHALKRRMARLGMQEE
jgi:DNA-binding NtrC family response regulator